MRFNIESKENFKTLVQCNKNLKENILYGRVGDPEPTVDVFERKGSTVL